MASFGQLSFMDAASPLMEAIIFFHDHAMLILTVVMSMVTTLFLFLTTSKATSRLAADMQALEVIWTIAPAIILVFLAIPSLQLLYLIDDSGSPAFTVKTTGHQWYWTYEYSELGQFSFDSYMVTPEQMTDTNSVDYRVLEVDNRLTLPTGVPTTLLVTSADVIHSWALPSMGMKADAIPGRMNTLNIFTDFPGVYYGQCSEICGVNHSFMPIVVEFINLREFLPWAKATQENLS
uniref:Cytochrome c oxidase subunit 2 n=1 Tax=Granata lyrata TaxID=479586 RepID=A0A0S1F5L6_GRALY|nr:cytochrome c oxidase subunit II [Granata lyrata]ALK03364.1 cytochrome c oxidase subunit II [Granata lyrata]